jgi:hypothetical protein
MLARILAELGPGSWLSAKPRIDPDARPLAYAYAPDPAIVKLRVAVGGGVLAVVCGIFLLFDVSDGIVVVALGGFGLFAAIHVLLALSEVGYRREIAFTDTAVRVDVRSLFGRRRFEEPLSAYSGVLLRAEQLADRGVGNQVSTKHYQIVELLHPDPSRSLPLWVEETTEPPRDVQERFAARLGLPALSPDVTGIAARRPDELDAALRDRDVEAPDPGPPPRAVTLRSDGSRTTVTVGFEDRGGHAGWLALAGGMALFVYILSNLVELEELLVVAAALLAMCLFMVAVGWGFYRAFVTMGLMHRGEDRPPLQALWIDDRALGVLTRGIALPRLLLKLMPRPSRVGPREDAVDFAVIEEIRVDRYTAYHTRRGDAPSDVTASHAYVLLVDADGRQLRFAAGHAKAPLVWLRDYLTHRIARSGARWNAR